ncbi:hypothetical protein [Sphingobacterium chungjuense]|uniref:hypothetical protein n=1 Tax=Sphingobacterium chungjuense TaxID=2675553 RepID=UPI0014090D43|nr:hypothetical protein [Sphingobacterium chungjuense]
MTFKHQTNRITKFFMLLLFVPIFSSCQKEETIPEIPMDLPSAVTLNFGQEQQLDLTKSYSDKNNIQFSLDFANTEDVAITNEKSLRQYLEKGIAIHPADGLLHISSEELFPNGALSSNNEKKIPEDYKVTIIATDGNGNVVGRHNLSIKVQAPSIVLTNQDTDASAEFSYMLYGETSDNKFNLSFADSVQRTGIWKVITKTGTEQIGSVSGHTLSIKALPKPQEIKETNIDIQTSFEKDGFTIAVRDFRIMFIPKIDFFFGQYYPEYDLTIDESLRQIGLSNAFVSNAPALFPENYKGTFSLHAIKKDGNEFEDTNNVFSVDQATGIVRVKKNETLTAGRYAITVHAKTTLGLILPATLTLSMESYQE